MESALIWSVASGDDSKLRLPIPGGTDRPVVGPPGTVADFDSWLQSRHRIAFVVDTLVRLNHVGYQNDGVAGPEVGVGERPHLAENRDVLEDRSFRNDRLLEQRRDVRML